MANLQIKGIKVNGVGYELNLGDIVSHLTSPNGTDYILKVDDNGNLYAEGGSGGGSSVTPIDPPTGDAMTTAISPKSVNKLYINSLYCGGLDADEHSTNYCSHNFVELSNLTSKDINLSNMSLQYAIQENGWYVLPLKGVIKAGSTFLIRGAQCAPVESAKIKVENFDMEWKIDSNNDYSESGTPIKFSDVKAKFYLTFGSTRFSGNQPFNPNNETTPKVPVGYIDLVGINADGYEKNPYSTTEMSKKLFKKYYAMDPVKQATKDVSARDNSKWINYVDLSKRDGEVIPNIEDFTPRASSEGKNIFYNKTKLSDAIPSVITCSFGIQATDNTASGGEGATRCFNWLRKGNANNEFLWIRPKGNTNWGQGYESFKNETGNRSFYNRKTKVYSDGSVITAHKYIKKGLTAGEYEYIAGYANADGTPDLEHCTSVRTFTVRTDADVNNGFTFVQTSDQQGFNWDEYEVWKAAAKCIEKEDTNHDIQFMVNTGDMTQNGNRMGEWLDYFNAECDMMKNMEEMATIGNNDLSPRFLYEMGDGEDGSKLSLENIEFFFCFEMDEDNPPVFVIDGVSYYIPSLYSFNYGSVHFLCMNSEIKPEAEYNTSGTSVYGFSDYGNFYPKIKAWAQADMTKNKSNVWNIAYCHEMPFTIITTGVTEDYVEKGTPHSVATDNLEVYEGGNGRLGAQMNINMPQTEKYWFSEFCQTNDIRLCFGGHKHTQSTSWPLLENVFEEGGVRKVKSFKPIIVIHESDKATELAAFNNATDLVTLPDGRKFPNTWVDGTDIVSTYTAHTYLCEFKFDTDLPNGVNPVVYAMSQATAYKHTSNKELPSGNIPWMRYFFPTSKGATKPDNGQKYPFYTIWKITPQKIEGHVRKVYGVMPGGNFDINIHGPYVKNGMCANDNEHNIEIHSVNGIGAGYDNASTIIEIEK